MDAKMNKLLDELLKHRVGTQPLQGWLRDSDESRTTLTQLAALRDPAASKCGLRVGDGQRCTLRFDHTGACESRSAPAAVTGEAQALPRVRHKRRRTVYEVLGEAVSQSEVPVPDESPMTVYRDPASGQLWARPTEEFNDGRFEPVSAPAPSIEPAAAARDVPNLGSVGVAPAA